MEYSNPSFGSRDYVPALEMVYSPNAIGGLIKNSRNSSTIEYYNFTGKYIIVSDRTGVSRVIFPKDIQKFPFQLDTGFDRNQLFMNLKTKEVNKFLIRLKEEFDTEDEIEVYKRWLYEQSTKVGEVIHNVKNIITTQKSITPTGTHVLEVIFDLEEVSSIRRSGNVIYYSFLDIVLTVIEDQGIIDKINEKRITTIDSLKTRNLNSQVDVMFNSNFDRKLQEIEREILTARTDNLIRIYRSMNLQNSFPFVNINPYVNDSVLENATGKPNNDINVSVTLVDSGNLFKSLFTNILGNNTEEIFSNKKLEGEKRNGLYVNKFKGRELLDSREILFDHKTYDQIVKELAENNFFTDQTSCVNNESRKLHDKITSLEDSIKDLKEKQLNDLKKKDDEVRKREDEIRKLESKIEEMKLEDKEKERLHKENMRQEDVKQKEKESQYDFWKRIIGIFKEAFVFLGSLLTFLKVFKVI